MPQEPPFHIILHDEVGSTMEAARGHVAEGQPVPLWCLAARQTGGRGRRGRRWQSPAGNFYGTLVLKAAPGLPVQLYTFIMGVALHEALAELAGGVLPGLRLKWPNDLLYRGDKLAGVLAETEEGLVYAGLGVNLMEAPQADYATACLAQAGLSVSPAELARQIHHRFFRLLDEALADGAGSIFKQWALRGPERGKELKVTTPVRTFVGVYDGVDETGQLLLKTQEGLIKLSTGDVAF